MSEQNSNVYKLLQTDETTSHGGKRPVSPRVVQRPPQKEEKEDQGQSGENKSEEEPPVVEKSCNDGKGPGSQCVVQKQDELQKDWGKSGKNKPEEEEPSVVEKSCNDGNGPGSQCVVQKQDKLQKDWGESRENKPEEEKSSVMGKVDLAQTNEGKIPECEDEKPYDSKTKEINKPSENNVQYENESTPVDEKQFENIGENRQTVERWDSPDIKTKLGSTAKLFPGSNHTKCIGKQLHKKLKKLMALFFASQNNPKRRKLTKKKLCLMSRKESSYTQSRKIIKNILRLNMYLPNMQLEYLVGCVTGHCLNSDSESEDEPNEEILLQSNGNAEAPETSPGSNDNAETSTRSNENTDFPETSTGPNENPEIPETSTAPNENPETSPRSNENAAQSPTLVLPHLMMTTSGNFLAQPSDDHDDITHSRVRVPLESYVAGLNCCWVSEKNRLVCQPSFANYETEDVAPSTYGRQISSETNGEEMNVIGHAVGGEPNSWHREEYEGLPILRENSSHFGYQDTCPLDHGLMIIMCQMFWNSYLLDLFSRSCSDIFEHYLPELFYLLQSRQFENIRRMCARQLGLRSKSFHGSDGAVMMNLFSSLPNFSYLYRCTNLSCPCNGRSFDMSGMRLRCPSERWLDLRVLQHIIDEFSESTEGCREQLMHTRPDSSQLATTYSNFHKESYCCGIRTTTITIVSEPELPPIIVLNMSRSRLRRELIGDLRGRISINGHNYFIGGVTFAANEHFTARIISQQGEILFYDNSRGIHVLVRIVLESHDAELSLIFLLRCNELN